MTEELVLIEGVISDWGNAAPVYVYADYLGEHDLVKEEGDLRLALQWLELAREWEAAGNDDTKRAILARMAVNFQLFGVQYEEMTEPGEAMIHEEGLSRAIYEEGLPRARSDWLLIGQLFNLVLEVEEQAKQLIRAVVNDREVELTCRRMLAFDPRFLQEDPLHPWVGGYYRGMDFRPTLPSGIIHATID